MGQILYGHRGAAGEAPENTLDGFAYARRIGVRAFELDVRLSADAQLVVIHDATLERTANAVGKVSDFTTAQLKRLDARNTCPTWKHPVGVPTLTEVLQLHNDLDAFQLEVKSDRPDRLERVCAQLIGQVEHFQIAERTIVTSFDPSALEIIRRLAPRQCCGFISNYDQPKDLNTVVRLGCWNACIPVETGSKEAVRAARENGLHVTGWLGNSHADLETLLDWSVDSITSDCPSVAIPFLRERGFLD